MAELMLINPRKRRRKHKMSTKQRRYFGKRTHAKKRRRRTSLVAAPRRRHYMSNPHKRHKRYRRNPSIGGFRPMAFMKDTLMPSAVGAAGALGLDMLLGFVPLPAMLKTPAMRPIVRIAGAVGIGIIAGMVTNKRIGEQVGAGALTVVLYDTLKGFVTAQFPTLTLGDLPNQYPTMEYLSPAPQVEDLSAYVSSDYSPVGEYVY
jgi:hypothetical protein